jgi:hypothetical protein
VTVGVKLAEGVEHDVAHVGYGTLRDVADVPPEGVDFLPLPRSSDVSPVPGDSARSEDAADAIITDAWGRRWDRRGAPVPHFPSVTGIECQQPNAGVAARDANSQDESKAPEILGSKSGPAAK